jgi:ribosomal-protein-alanine N-acetyltransferase
MRGCARSVRSIRLRSSRPLGRARRPDLPALNRLRLPGARPGSGRAERSPRTLRGARIRIRPLRLSDAAALGRILRDRRVTRMLPSRVRREDGRRFVTRVLREQRAGDGAAFAILPIDADRVVGQIRLFNRSRWERQAEVGFWLRRRCWGRGFGSEALRLVCEFGFRSLDLHRIVAFVVVGNERSARALEAVGFRREGRSRRAARTASGWADVWCYGLLRGERRRGRRLTSASGRVRGPNARRVARRAAPPHGSRASGRGGTAHRSGSPRAPRAAGIRS